MTVTKRTALGVLTRARLLKVATKAGHGGLTGKRREEIVETLASSRRAGLAELLAHYSRDELKSACKAAGLSTKGREKALIVDRLLGNGAANSDAKPVPKKTPKQAVTKPMSKRSIRHYDYPDKRPNNPPVGLVTPETDPPVPTKQTYAYDPHLDPALQFDSAGAEIERILEEGLAAEDLDAAKEALQELRRRREPYLAWAGKAERTSFEVDTVSLHVHERIDPKTLIEARARLVEPADRGRLAAGDELLAGEGGFRRKVPDGLLRPAVRRALWVELPTIRKPTGCPGWPRQRPLAGARNPQGVSGHLGAWHPLLFELHPRPALAAS